MSSSNFKKNYSIDIRVPALGDLVQISHPKPGYRVYVYEEQKYYFWEPITEGWEVENISNGGSYSLPPASAETLGGIKLGSDFVLDGDNFLLLANSSSNAIIEGSRGEILSLLNSDSLVPGQTYKITDRGDRGIFVTAISSNYLSPYAIRVMLCPANYSFTNSTWKGIWHIDRSYAINKRVIWGGKVWNHLTTSTGTAVDILTLDDVNWAPVSKEDFTDEYSEKIFGCRYNITSDWIERQWDGNGNEFGASASDTYNFLGEYFSVRPFPLNLCDLSDWNFATRTGGTLGTDSASFSQNRCMAVFNNFGTIIINNLNTGVIANNSTDSIRLNTNSGDIINNKCTSIFNNGGSGRIIDNTCGIIYSNTGCIIKNNTIPGNIISNWSNDIYDNTNNGDISLNYCGEIIWNNSNNGNIISNYCSKQLALNTNNGNISYNYNSGEISDNSNLGNITNNRNNGDISFVNSTLPCNIKNNINNGSITGTFIEDVEDTVVDKVGT